MFPRALIDLHCDTLTALSPEDAPRLTALRDPLRRQEAAAALMDKVQKLNTLDLPGRHFSLSAVPQEVSWCQCCAIFIPDGLEGEEAVAYYDFHRRSFQRQMEALSGKVLPCRTAADIEAAWSQGKAAAVLTVENGSALAGRLDRIEVLARDGVRMMTLTWNGENEIGSGNVTDHGLSPFGREAVLELERQGVILDVSHLNDQGFDDLLKTAQKPFVASHSNAREVCHSVRNMKDDMIRRLADRGGVMGLNFCADFLEETLLGEKTPGSIAAVVRHAKHIVSVGGIEVLGLGSDFDGIETNEELPGAQSMGALWEALSRAGFSEEQLDKIFYKNVLRVYEDTIK